MIRTIKLINCHCHLIRCLQSVALAGVVRKPHLWYPAVIEHKLCIQDKLNLRLLKQSVGEILFITNSKGMTQLESSSYATSNESKQW